MTKEECIGLLERYAEYGIPNLAGCREAMKMAADLLSQPSLPSDLDEAAEDSWAVYEYRESPRGLYSTCYVDGFKAGAEWMAEQFVLVGGEPTDWFRTNDGSEYATGLDLKEPIKLPVDFYVRKK